jgi:hypothetical protein
MKTHFIVVIGALLVGCGDKEQTKNDAAVDTTTGGGSDASGTADTTSGDGANATCSTCVMTSCGTQHTACQNDTPCNCTYNCIINGGAEGSCKTSCSLPGNNTPWSDLSGCIDTSCMTACQ